jgi:hypothetical protein
VTALWDALDAVPAMQFYGWSAVVLVAFSVGAHFATWRQS